MSQNALIALKPNERNELINSLEDILTLAKIAAASKMFPEVTTEQHAAVKILAGRELGVPPMAALRGIHVIKGKAEIGAGLLAAMIKQSGKYNYAVVNADDSIAEIAWYESGALVGRSAFTLADAERAGLVQPGSAWKKYPRAMLFARALTEGQRRYAPDVAIGAAYAPGEVEGEVIDVTPEAEIVTSESGGYVEIAAFQNSGKAISEEIKSSAYAERLSQRVEAYEREKAEKADAVPVAPTATGLRADVIDLVSGIKKKHKISHAGAIKQISTHLGRVVERAADIGESELQGVYEMLEQWDADLTSIAQEKL